VKPNQTSRKTSIQASGPKIGRLISVMAFLLVPALMSRYFRLNIMNELETRLGLLTDRS
jgi:hypothetical protein